MRILNNGKYNLFLSSILLALSFTVFTCQSPGKMETEEQSMQKPVRLITVDPGHFHAALVQKSTYDAVDSLVHVYGPAGPDIDLHLNRIDGFNQRAENPTNWNEKTYLGDDFFEKMLAEKSGNVVVLSGNNRKKMEYIAASLENGLNVLADKPMVINSEEFELLRSAFETAKNNKVLLYDIMTERFEITTRLQKQLSQMPEIFGELEQGTVDNPAITKESVHHFFKYVSGNILTRPPWFMDVEQQGEGIVDVTTHLIDLIQWEAFPETIIDYTSDIKIESAKRWPTLMNPAEFGAITKLDAFPDYLQKDIVDDSILHVFCNGEINYQLKGVHAKVSVIWAYKAPEGAGDTHFSIMRGTKSNLVIRQGEEQEFVPTLYIEPIQNNEQFAQDISTQFVELEKLFPGIAYEPTDKGFKVNIPEQYREGHEAHFSRVTENFLTYLENGTMPDWEVPNMIAKYYTSLKGLEMAKKDTQQ